MPLFQPSVLNKYLADLDKEKLSAAWKLFQANFHNPVKQENIRNAKEEQYQEGFLRELFVAVFDYTLNPDPHYNLTTEYKNEKDSKKADGAILKEGNVRAVIELKGTDTTDLSKIETQAFGYLHNQKGCTYVITSNFEKLRFYIEDATEHREFNLFTLEQKEFAELYLCLHKEHLLSEVPLQIKKQSVAEEDVITKKLYADYSAFKKALYQNLVSLNPQFDKLELFKKTQKLLDRFLFILFAEDRLLLPPNFIIRITDDWKQFIRLRGKQSLYERFLIYFADLLHGNKDEDIFAYNGGLFEPDVVLDSLKIEDSVLLDGVLKLSNYDYNSEVDVNILGHIFEHSLNEIEELQASIENSSLDKNKTRRKKEGVFYTPRYITKYIVENAIGALCTEKKKGVNLVEENYAPDKRKRDKKALLQKLDDYRSWLLQLTICDSACGSGAFLNAALEFLIKEHSYVDELTAKLLGHTMQLPWTPNDILEHNLFGVDINEEAVEIARLSLWLRTAQKGRKLSNLSNNIKCGNSLIDDKLVAGDKAFIWKEEFKDVFEKGGFDVVIGNPPYGAELKDTGYFKKNYSFKKFDSYELFVELSARLVNNVGLVGLIIPNSWMTHKAGRDFRRFLFGQSIVRGINFKKRVFEEANIDTTIILFTRKLTNGVVKALDVEKPEDILAINEYNDIQQKQMKELDKFNYSLSQNDLAIIEKMRSMSVRIDEVFNVVGGYKPYQVGYGKSIQGDFPQIESDIRGRVYHSNTKIDDSYFPDIKGININRYLITENTQWVKWGSWLMSPKKLEYFNNPKIVVREIAGKYLFASLDERGFLTNDTTHMILFNGDINSLKSLLCVLNSKLLGWYFKRVYGEDSDLFPKVKINEIKELPLHKNFETLALSLNADIMLSKNKELNTLKQGLLQLLSAKHEGITITNKLNDWPSLSFKEFLKEQEKQKIKLSLSEQNEWLNYFEREKQKAMQLQSVINNTDKEIDGMVYQLYGLTEDEIKIVEAS